MSWARFDDRYHDNRKVKRAWRRHPRAVGLHAMAVTYCAMHDTDGLVDAEWLEDKLPAKAEREKCLAALVDVGLFEPYENGDHRVHDFLEYNHSKEEKDALREQKVERQRKWRATRRETSGSASRDASTDASTNGVRDASRDTAPTPSRPDPTFPPLPPEGGRARDRVAYEGELAEFTTAHFPGIHPGYIEHFADILRRQKQDPTVEALRPLVEPYREVEAPT